MAPALPPLKSCYDAQIPLEQAKADWMYHYVYLLRSEINAKQTYVGCTHDLRKRLAEHNAGKSIHTNKFKPWDLMAYVALCAKETAEGLERYLKTDSGRALRGSID